MTELERMEKRFKQLRDFLLERQEEDPDADRDDEGDGYNIARVDLHQIKLAFFAMAQERDRLRDKLVQNADESTKTLTELRQRIETLTVERDEARRSCCEYAAIVDGADNTEGMESGRFHEVAMRYMKERNWDCFKEDDK